MNGNVYLDTDILKKMDEMTDAIIEEEKRLGFIRDTKDPTVHMNSTYVRMLEMMVGVVKDAHMYQLTRNSTELKPQRERLRASIGSGIDMFLVQMALHMRTWRYRFADLDMDNKMTEAFYEMISSLDLDEDLFDVAMLPMYHAAEMFSHRNHPEVYDVELALILHQADVLYRHLGYDTYARIVNVFKLCRDRMEKYLHEDGRKVVLEKLGIDIGDI